MAKSSPEETTPARLERRRKLMEMAKASFPDGVPDPYTLIDSFSKDHLPFICVTVKMYSEDGLEFQEFKSEWCL